MNADTQQKILDAVDAGFDAQLATTKEFVAIPSLNPSLSLYQTTRHIQTCIPVPNLPMDQIRPRPRFGFPISLSFT